MLKAEAILLLSAAERARTSALTRLVARAAVPGIEFAVEERVGTEGSAVHREEGKTGEVIAMKRTESWRGHRRES